MQKKYVLLHVWVWPRQLLLKGTRLNASDFKLTSPPPILVENEDWVFDESEEALEWLLPEELRTTTGDNRSPY